MEDQVSSVQIEAVQVQPSASPENRSGVIDAQSFAESVKEVLSRDEKGRFVKKEEPEAEEQPQDEPEEAQEAAEEAEPEQEAAPEEPPQEDAKKKKISDLQRKAEEERQRRAKSTELKTKAQEYDKVRPFLDLLVKDKVSTIDEILSDEEFATLCDARISKLQGKKQDQPTQDLEKKIEQKLAELDKREQERSASQAKHNYGLLVSKVSEKFEDTQTVKEWLGEHGYDFSTSCVEYADIILSKQNRIPTPEESASAIIQYVLQEIEISEKVKSKNKPVSEPVQEPESKKSKTKTLNSTLRGSAHKEPDVQVRNGESFATLVKQQLRKGK